MKKFNSLQEFKQHQKDLIQTIKLTKKSIQEAKKSKELDKWGNYLWQSFYYKSKKLKKEYRLYHIAYCSLRGTKYENIEKKTHKDNKPNMVWVHGIININKELKHEKNVCLIEA